MPAKACMRLKFLDYVGHTRASGIVDKPARSAAGRLVTSMIASKCRSDLLLALAGYLMIVDLL